MLQLGDLGSGKKQAPAPPKKADSMLDLIER